MFASSLKRVRRRVQRLRCERCCARQSNALAHHPGTIVTTFYDVEGDYARPGQTPTEITAIGRILEIEERYAIRSTYNVVARFALDAPDVVAAIAHAGNEIASHSYDHAILTRLDGSAVADNIRRTRQTFADLGIDIRGHRSPQSDWDDRVLDALVRHGYAWSAENGAEPYPYRIRPTDPRVLWRFPVADDDWSYESAGVSPGAMLEGWRRQVLAARGRRKHLAIGFHAWVEAGPGRLAALDEFFHWLVEQDGIQVMPFADVLRIMDRSAAPELAVAHG
jgi:peptidoglycan/xylan/chitin deacetylase (PgdA/CDA1 family)